MSTHNICFHGEIKKILMWVPLLSGAMHKLSYNMQKEAYVYYVISMAPAQPLHLCNLIMA